jgi:gamma-glutamylcyclotransferase (GGCT)/AIG2-like uncharacterized protein YtfP
MIADQKATELLFSYGTLRKVEVQLSTFGRKLEGSPGTLIGYRLTMIRIQDEHFVETSGTAQHRNLQFTGSESDIVEGTVFRVTMRELELADAYEPEGYKRVEATLKSGATTWVFVNVIL